MDVNELDSATVAEPPVIEIGDVLRTASRALGKGAAPIALGCALAIGIVTVLQAIFVETQGIDRLLGWPSTILSAWLSAHVAFVVRDVLEGHAPSFATSSSRAGRVLWPTFRLSILTGLMAGVGAILFLAPGIFVAAFSFVALPACVFEGRMAFASIERSGELTEGRRWRMAGLVLTIFAVAAAAFCLALVPLFVADPDAPETVLEARLLTIFLGFWQAFVQSFWVATSVVAYERLRPRTVDGEAAARVFE